MATKKWHVKDVKCRDLKLLSRYSLREHEVLYSSSRDLQDKLESKKMGESEKRCILKFRKRERSKACQSNELDTLECNIKNLVKIKNSLQREINNLKKEKEMFVIKNFLEDDNMRGEMPLVCPAEIDDVIQSLGSVMGSVVEKL